MISLLAIWFTLFYVNIYCLIPLSWIRPCHQGFDFPVLRHSRVSATSFFLLGPPGHYTAHVPLPSLFDEDVFTSTRLDIFADLNLESFSKAFKLDCLVFFCFEFNFFIKTWQHTHTHKRPSKICPETVLNSNKNNFKVQAHLFMQNLAVSSRRLYINTCLNRQLSTDELHKSPRILCGAAGE